MTTITVARPVSVLEPRGAELAAQVALIVLRAFGRLFAAFR